MMKKCLSLILTLMLLCLALPALGESGSMTVINCNEWVSLRSQPDEKASRLVKVPLGAQVYDCDQEGDWIQCRYGTTTGYILARYLTPTTRQTQTVVNAQMTVIAPEGAALWLTADQTAEPLLTVPQGSVVSQCQSYANGMTFCHFSGYTGFVLTSCLEGAQQTEETVQEGPQDMGSMKVVNCQEWVSLREMPDAKSERLVKVPLGDTVDHCTQADNGFIFCQYQDMQGYIQSQYLTRVDEPQGEDPWLEATRSRIEEAGCLAGVMLISSHIDRYASLLEDPEYLNGLLGACPLEAQALLHSIPEEYFAQMLGGQQLYLVVTADPNASITVNEWSAGTAVRADQNLVRAQYGQPVLVRCTVSGFYPDCQVFVNDTQGRSVAWYPFLDQSTGAVRVQGQGGNVLDLTPVP